MNLTTLKSLLDGAKTGTGLNLVYFDYSSVLNKRDKVYPLALWDFDNVDGLVSMESGVVDVNKVEKTMTVNCWCINLVSPESDVVDKHVTWDAIEVVMLKYINAVNAAESITVENMRAIPYSYFPAGLLSLEREMAVRYSVDLKLHCYTPPAP